MIFSDAKELLFRRSKSLTRRSRLLDGQPVRLTFCARLNRLVPDDAAAIWVENKSAYRTAEAMDGLWPLR